LFVLITGIQEAIDLLNECHSTEEEPYREQAPDDPRKK